MATQGPMIWIDRALQKLGDGTIKLSSDTFHAVLLGSAQVISATFIGGSGDARYADLTAEFPTANGYTVGGVALSGTAFSRPAVNQAAWTTAAAQWTLSGTLAGVKYMAIVDWTAANKDIVMYCDFDTGGGTISPPPPMFAQNPDPTYGWGNWQQL